VTIVDASRPGPATTRLRPGAVAVDPVRFGTVFALATAAAYFLGAGRPLDYDGSITTGLFVKRGSLLDVFRSVYAFNNQPYFSFVEHIVWGAGGRSEVWLRVVPIVAGAAVVGIVAAWSARRWGLVAGLIAGSTVAANPMFASLARSVRGYSLMVLGCTVATLIFVDARDRRRSMSPLRSVCYVAALGIAIGTQFYAVLVLAAHVVMLVHDHRFDEAWRRRTAAIVAVGALPYVGMARDLVATSSARTGGFLPAFPLDTAREVLGHEPVAVAVFAALMLLALATVEWRRGPAPAIATVAVALLAIWTILHPLDLYPRFLVWLVPAVALAAAFAVAHHPRLTVLLATAVAITAMALPQISTWTTAPIASREIARVVVQTRARHLQPCATGSNGEVLAGYTDPVRSVTSAADIDGCDLLFGMPQTSGSLLRELACRFEAHTVLRGTVAIVVMTRPDPSRPVPC
jgi:Dolichyl-phosphate-mannose-protein mannosyltransferase